MGVFVIDEEKFYERFNQFANEIRQQIGAKPRDKWVDGEEAMQIMRIKSKTTLQRLREEGKIRFTRPEPKSILYDRDSIDAYLEKHAKNTF